VLTPIVAYALCSELSTGHLFAYRPGHGINVAPLRHHAFLASGIISGAIFLGDIVSRRWGLFWLPLVSLLLTWLLYFEAVSLTRFLASAEPAAPPNATIAFLFNAERQQRSAGESRRSS